MTRVWCWAVLALSVRSVSAQNAGLSGVILDPASATVSGAEVSLRNEQTGGRRTAKSSADGFYNFASLKPGEYRLSVRASGFETMIQEGIHLEVGASARIDFNLRIGDARTEVTIHSGSALMNTQDASVGTVIDRELIDKMPLNGRGIQSLIELSPGTVVVPGAPPMLRLVSFSGGLRHRSTSPMTISIDPTMAGTSASKTFRQSSPVTARLTKEGPRILTR